ncbi:hypothetical protein K435DRAFT_803429 [Dendrothele bispora CBS 962.96]|uniref:Uncharacterized protein n=1 Tax=Dendrothele bispora (strain CBS 962.96) TaxID=1314807 RepID=A0A4S8LI87_DENBC|nr:hypothetical protein K435DRAFT_803429 [Dendrothele bispora CBS 962.96]
MRERGEEEKRIRPSSGLRKVYSDDEGGLSEDELMVKGLPEMKRPPSPEQNTSMASTNTAISFGAGRQHWLKGKNDGRLGEGEVTDYPDNESDLGTPTTLMLQSLETKEKEGGWEWTPRTQDLRACSSFMVVSLNRGTIQTRRRGRNNNSPTPQSNLPQILRNAKTAPRCNLALRGKSFSWSNLSPRAILVNDTQFFHSAYKREEDYTPRIREQGLSKRQNKLNLNRQTQQDW